MGKSIRQIEVTPLGPVKHSNQFMPGLMEYITLHDEGCICVSKELSEKLSDYVRGKTILKDSSDRLWFDAEKGMFLVFVELSKSVSDVDERLRKYGASMAKYRKFVRREFPDYPGNRRAASK